MKSKIIFTALIAVILYGGCMQEAKIQPKDYPYVITKDVINIDSTGVTLVAEILDYGQEEIIDFGFVLGGAESEYQTSLFEKGESPDNFTLRISNGLESNGDYVCQAFIKTEKHEVYGNKVSFISKGSLPPSIHDFIPKFGSIGSQVEIIGENFLPSISGNTVKFGQVLAIIDSATENKLIVRIPTISKPEKVNITVETTGKIVTSTELFDLWFPWIQKNDFGGKARANAVSFVVNNKAYVGTGTIANNTSKDFWEYNPETDTWTKIADFQGGYRKAAVAFTLNDEGYVGTGYYMLRPHRDFWKYTPSTNSWTYVTSLPGVSRDGAVAFTINGKAYVGAGQDGDGNYLNDFWEYNPIMNTWTSISDFPGSPRSFPVSFTIGGKAYVGAGGGNSNGYYYTDFWKYDPLTNAWSQINDFPGRSRSRGVAFSLNSKAYFGTGLQGDSKTYNDFWEYDYINDEWINLEDVPGIGRHGTVAFTVGDRAFLGLGATIYYAESLVRTFWEFDPSQINTSTY